MKRTLFLAVLVALILVTGASAQDLEKARQEGRLVFAPHGALAMPTM